MGNKFIVAHELQACTIISLFSKSYFKLLRLQFMNLMIVCTLWKFCSQSISWGFFPNIVKPVLSWYNGYYFYLYFGKNVHHLSGSTCVELHVECSNCYTISPIHSWYAPTFAHWAGVSESESCKQVAAFTVESKLEAQLYAYNNYLGGLTVHLNNKTARIKKKLLKKKIIEIKLCSKQLLVCFMCALSCLKDLQDLI